VVSSQKQKLGKRKYTAKDANHAKSLAARELKKRRDTNAIYDLRFLFCALCVLLPLMNHFANQIQPSESQPLWSGFYRSALAFPARPALEVDGQAFTYEQLKDRAAALAAALTKHSLSAEPPLTAVFAYRSVTAFAGVLGALFAGHGYVPLNRTFPTDRTRVMLERSRCRSVIIDGQSAAQLEEVLAGVKDQLLLVFPETEDVKPLVQRWPQHRVLGKGGLEPAVSWLPPADHQANAIAYLLFTSGSTGTPKGVMVSHRNVRHYVEWTGRRYSITKADRVSQTFDMTFDLSAHDMFAAWERGACVCCPSQKAMIKPGRFIRDSRLTIWFSVPSTAVFMKRFGELKPGLYPGLRLSLFCGEALPMDVAKAWSSAAPNSVVENIYGPTELTIACTAYRWDAERSPGECEQGTVPIGEPFEGMKTLVADENLNEVAPGADGELLMTGPQLSLGYWQDKEKTAKAFVVPPGKSEVYYRTGDRVRRPLDGKPMVYLGRMDNQIKILGHRVELGEIEAVIRQASGVDGVVAVGWPVTTSGADGIVVFLQADSADIKALQEDIKSRLPAYMVPKNIRLLPRFPLNANGKFDRKALLATLQATL
jgi:amino acid adenylation domain-containing protein